MVAPGSGNSAENASHTGELAGYTGEDVQFNPTSNGQTITITFNTEVKNANFTLYDIDKTQVISVAATNALAVPQVVNITTQAGTILTIGGIFPLPTTITSANTALANNVNTGSATISVTGPVKTITLTISTIGSDPVFWLSDINACVTGSFPANYQKTGNNQPFTGPAGNQPDYFLVTPDNNSVYMVDPLTAQARWLFTDAARTYVNSFAYDPYNRLLYYISENVSLDANNKALKRYDFTTGTITTLVADISTTLGIPTMNSGVESAGAAFYDGAIYMGIEGGKYDVSGTTNDRTRETIIWRIDLDGSLNPINAYQVFATDAYLNASNTSIHDWGDFIVKDGILIDFNTARNSSNYSESKYHHYNLMTGNMDAVYVNPGTTIWNGQGALTWSGDLYYFRETTAGNSGVGYYDGAGNNSAPIDITLIGSGPAWPGGAGDASESFRPKCDFGDAPASYDPVATSPAVHENSDNLRLGATWDNEWVKTSSAGANADGADEDGIATVPTLDTGNFNYLITIDAYNNTGANATVAAWLDYNGNGVFDASEGLVTTISSSASLQPINLVWWGINTPLLIGQSTYLRVRITSASKGMTTANPTGYYYDGEVEDYQVMVSSVLPVDLLYFDAKLLNDNAVKLDWKTTHENNVGQYVIERSANGSDWQEIGRVAARNQQGDQQYGFTDNAVLNGQSFYRIRITRKTDGSAEKYSAVKTINVKKNIGFEVTPNPVRNIASLAIHSTLNQPGTLRLMNLQGVLLEIQKLNLIAGENNILLENLNRYPSGSYVIQISSGDGSFIRQFIIKNE
ncbi:MAG: T9SS type A sorting domain-containing protein [Terrimonas sp.]|nr:T9SS type A sorting domain-containing protein [Terrimonas sp.]